MLDELWPSPENADRAFAAIGRHFVWAAVICPATVCVEAMVFVQADFVTFVGGALVGCMLGLGLLLGLAPAAQLQFLAAGAEDPGARGNATTLGRIAARYGVNALIVLVPVGLAVSLLGEMWTAFGDALANVSVHDRPTPFDVLRTLTGAVWLFSTALPGLAILVCTEWAAVDGRWKRFGATLRGAVPD